MTGTAQLIEPMDTAEARVRPLRESDLDGADKVFRVAFGTFLGLPDPRAFLGDADYLRTRWRTDPAAAFAAEIDGSLVGSNVATRWGTVGFFGPLSVSPHLWDRGIAQRLMDPVLDCFQRWGVTHAGLFTWPHSPKHLALYQRYGFWPRFLTPVLSRPVGQQPAAPSSTWTAYSSLTDSARADCLRKCAELTDRIYDGLDVSREIVAVQEQGLGETVVLTDDAGAAAFGVCHLGAGTEAGSGTCFLKFGAARPGPRAGENFGRLLDAVNAVAAARGASRLVVGVNTGRHEAYRSVLARGFRIDMQGIAMHRPNEPGYNRPDVYLVDDWR